LIGLFRQSRINTSPQTQNDPLPDSGRINQAKPFLAFISENSGISRSTFPFFKRFERSEAIERLEPGAALERLERSVAVERLERPAVWGVNDKPRNLPIIDE